MLGKRCNRYYVTLYVADIRALAVILLSDFGKHTNISKRQLVSWCLSPVNRIGLYEGSADDITDIHNSHNHPK